MRKTLVYGFGNPGRQDDALGILLVEKLEQWLKEYPAAGVETDSNYQLNIEDAAGISSFDRVIFADASREENIAHFKITAVEPSGKVEFTMHAVSPSFILHLCQSIYEKKPETLLLHIRGHEWELAEGLTERAAGNLDLAFSALKEML